MTQRVFWLDPYLTVLDTVVTNVAAADVRVEKSIFYACSGGQEGDVGTIAGQVVQAARLEGDDLVYTLGMNHGLKPGDPVTMAIVWQRRYRLMRLHLAAEIVLELVCQTLPGIEKVGANISADKARRDFRWPDNIASMLTRIQKQAEALIVADKDIVSDFSDTTERERFWEIAGFARVPCGGTHLRTTGEIGQIELRRRNPGRGKERIEVTLSPAETVNLE